MKRYTVDWRCGVLRDENNVMVDPDWVKKVCLADEVDAEIARLRKVLEDILRKDKEMGEYIIRAREALAPEKEKGKDVFEKLPPWKMKDIEIKEKDS